jgi:hypothetical protein
LLGMDFNDWWEETRSAAVDGMAIKGRTPREGWHCSVEQEQVTMRK